MEKPKTYYLFENLVLGGFFIVMAGSDRMADYMLVEKQDGTIEFWTNDEDLRLRVLQNINDIEHMINTGATRKDICRKYGVSSETLRRFLAEMNISS